MFVIVLYSYAIQCFVMLHCQCTSPVPDTYFSVESLELAVSPEHKMFPLVEQNFHPEELQTGETHKQDLLAMWHLVFAILEMLQ